MALNRDAQKILDWLVLHLPNVTPGKLTKYLSYGEGLQELSVINKRRGRTDGEYLNELALEELALWLLDSGKPAITGLIIDKTSKKPGKGYFEVNERETTDGVWWKGEIANSKKFEIRLDTVLVIRRQTEVEEGRSATTARSGDPHSSRLARSASAHQNDHLPDSPRHKARSTNQRSTRRRLSVLQRICHSCRW